MNLTKLQGLGVAVALMICLCPCVGVALADPKPDTSNIKAGPITVQAKPITSFKRFSADEPLAKLTFRGGLVLTSPSPQFGGWSGLVLADDARSFLSISDAGVWMTGELAYDGTHPAGMRNVRLGPLLDREGMPLARSRDRDSESIALQTGTLQHGSVLVGFEQKHRIERYDLTPDGLSEDRGGVRLPPAAKRMHSNQGLEALTVMKGGTYKGSPIAFSERLLDLSRNHTGWLWTKVGPQTIHLKNIDDYDVTDISSLDDGTLFILERRFNWVEGVRMRLRRIAPDQIAPDRTLDGEILIEADLNNNIDNMEGLSATRLSSGEVLITMISDDNFDHLFQRTLLLQFTVKDSEQPKTRP